MKESPVDFNVRENEEFIAIVTDFTLQENSKKLIFSVDVISEKYIHHHLKSLVKYPSLPTT